MLLSKNVFSVQNNTKKSKPPTFCLTILGLIDKTEYGGCGIIVGCDMMPTYLIFNKKGELIYSSMGFPCADVIKAELMKCAK